MLLHLKKGIAWIQPTEVKTKAREFAVTPDQILKAAMAAPALQVRSWDDIARIDIRPDRGLVKISAQNHWELQLHSATGETLQVAYRRSDLIESIHDGSWFHDAAKLWLFFPSDSAVWVVADGDVLVCPAVLGEGTAEGPIGLNSQFLLG